VGEFARVVVPLLPAFLAWSLLQGATPARAVPGPSSDPPAAAAAGPPAPKIGGDIRVRGEAFDNALDLHDDADDSYQYIRMRYRAWIDARPRDPLQIYFRLGGEYRWGQQAAMPDTSVPGPSSIRDPESRVSLDNGWVQIAWPEGSGLTFRLGRQDLAYGEGFLIFDGTPADGSSSSYFDALKASWAHGPYRVDAFAAKLLDQGFGSGGRDEDFHGLYAVRALPRFPAANVEAYALHRFQRGPEFAPSRPPGRVLSGRQWTGALGARFSSLPETGPQLAVEGAYQAGEVDEKTGAVFGERWRRVDRRAFGGYARLGAISPARGRPAGEFGALYLSGGRDGEDNRSWDPFYSEWPKWSELLIYTMYDLTTRHPEDRRRGDAGAWTNLLALWAEFRIEPASGTKAAVRGTLLRSAEGEDFADAGSDSRERGFLIAARLEQALPGGATVQLLGERFEPGGFYDRRVFSGDGARTFEADPAWYARLQLAAGF